MSHLNLPVVTHSYHWASLWANQWNFLRDYILEKKGIILYHLNFPYSLTRLSPGKPLNN